MRSLLFSLFLFISFIGQAQETRVAFDSNGKYETIDNSQNNTYHFFPEYESLYQASLYQLSDSTYSLEIEYFKEGKSVRIRKALNQSGFHTLRERVDAQLLLPAVKPLDQSGRVPLIVFSSMLGLSYYGWILPTAIDIQDSKTFLSLYLFTAASSFFVPYFATRDKEVTKGMSTLTNFGLSVGLVHGAVFYNLFDNNSFNNQALMFSTLGFGLAEGFGFYHLARIKQFSYGQSAAMSWYSSAGALFTVGASYALGNSNEKLAFGTTLLGAAGGFGLGYYFSHQQKYSLGDVIFSSSATSIAAFNAMALMFAFEQNDARPNIGAAVIGSAIGAIWSHYYTRDRNYKTSNAIYIGLGGLGGGLLGAGLGVLVSPDNTNGQGIMLLAAAGATTGFLLTNRLLKNDNESKSTVSKFNININPAALLTVKRAYNPNLLGGGIIPAVNVSYSF